jgi:hypothetical protein
MWVFRVVGWVLYRVQSPRPDDKWKTTDVSLIVPTIDCDEEALTEAIRSWVLNEPFEILIVTVGMLPLFSQCSSLLQQNLSSAEWATCVARGVVQLEGVSVVILEVWIMLHAHSLANDGITNQLYDPRET